MTAEILSHAAEQVRHARTPRQRAAIVARLAELLGCTTQTAYRKLHAAGWDSGRAARSDKGERAVSREEVEELATILARGRNKRGQPNIPASEAHRLAVEHGLGAGRASYSTVARRLREEGMSLGHMRAAQPSVARVSAHPNHVWFFDISIAIQWYFRDEAGQKLDLYTDAGARFYEGKRQNFTSSRQVIHRFLVVDHASGAYYCQYYYSAGENAADVVDFLWRAMSPKPHAGEALPMRGLPRRMVFDQGPANKSQSVRNLLEGLDVEPEWHAPRNAKASGAVETRHNHWQRSFEGRLALQPARHLLELNAHAERLCALQGGDPERAIARHGMAPLAAWATISAGQFREAPGRDEFLQLAASDPRTGTLNNWMHLRADGLTWQLKGRDLCPGQKVTYRLSPWTEAGVRAWDKQGRELACERIAFDKLGFAVNGLRHEWDNPDAQGAAHPEPIAQAIARKVASGELAPPSLDVFGGLDERLDRQRYLAPQPQPWERPSTPLAAEPVMGDLDAREEVARRLARNLNAQEAQWWRERAARGLVASDLDAALAEFTGAATPLVASRRAQGA